MVEEHIHKLLFDHDCVIIPDFGGLITHYAPARIHPVKHTFLPPSKRIAFNEKLKLNDGLLISTFAYDHHISTEEAQFQVADYVRQLQASLLANRQYDLKGIGLFRYNAEQKIEFEYVPVDNFLNDSFGLPEIISHPITRVDAADNLRNLLKDKKADNQIPVTKPSWRRRLRRVYDTAAVMVIASLSVTALYVISLQNEYSQSSLNPFAIFNLAGTTVLDTKAVHLPEAAIPAVESVINEDAAATPKPTASELVENTPAAIETPVKETENSTASVTTKEIGAENTATRTEETTSVKKELPAKTAAAPEASTTKRISATIKKSTGRYYVIAGGYSTLQNAEYSRKVANRFGAQGKVIMPYGGSKLYRVSIADFGTKEEALAYLPQLKNKYGKNIWLLNY